MTGCSRLGAVSSLNKRRGIEGRRTGKLLCFFRWYSPQVPQIALVPHQHDYNVGVRMIPEFFQPPLDVLVCLVFADVVDQ